ncbi:ComF family protein [Glutamicibacter arilaitensis]|uniref:ComF family protein n=1 Tax=Glutamicibacter arilaitensis TaxID=256701 RepID=UPI00384F52F0
MRETLNLLLPTSCAICERADFRLCPECRYKIHQQLFLPPLGDHLQFYIELPSVQWQLPVSASGIYSNELARAILAYKNKQRYFLGQEFAPFLAAAINISCPPRLFGQPTLVVPMPSSVRALSARGYRPVEVMLNMAQRRGLLGEHTRTSSVLHYRFSELLGGQQKKKTGHARRAGDTQLIAEIPEHFKQPIILVDDVTTTGSTLRKAALACSEAGYDVIGAVVLAFTKPPSIDEDKSISLNAI